VLKPNVVIENENDKTDSVLGVRISNVYRSMSMFPGQAAEFASTSSKRVFESTFSLFSLKCCFGGGGDDVDVVPHTPGERSGVSRLRGDRRDTPTREKSRIGNDLVEAEDYGITSFRDLSDVGRRSAGLETDDSDAGFDDDDDDFPKTPRLPMREHTAMYDTMDDAQVTDYDDDE